MIAKLRTPHDMHGLLRTMLPSAQLVELVARQVVRPLGLAMQFAPLCADVAEREDHVLPGGCRRAAGPTSLTILELAFLTDGGDVGRSAT